jgi:protein-L-isoaspartate(D-aspartate) O-methyltransferase
MNQVDENGHWPGITDPVVRTAVAAVPRHLFVPPSYRDAAYDDTSLPIGYGQTISQPYIVAVMTQALCLTPNSRVLEIGTGSGYQAAVLAEITPHVWSIETRPELGETAARRLADLNYSVKVRIGDGSLGWPEEAPFDGIIVTAAVKQVPPALVAQLAECGRLVIPVGDSSWDQELCRIERSGELLRLKRLAAVRFVPLVVSCGSELVDPSLTEISHKLHDLFRKRRY